MNNFKYLKRLLYFFVFIPALYLFTDLATLSWYYQLLVVLIEIVVFSPLIYPLLKLYWSYYNNDKNFRLENGDVEIKLFDLKLDKEIRISRLEKYLRHPNMDRYFDFLLWSDYYYYILTDEDGRKHIATCLLMEGMDIQEQVEIHYVKIPKLPTSTDLCPATNNFN